MKIIRLINNIPNILKEDLIFWLKVSFIILYYIIFKVNIYKVKEDILRIALKNNKIILNKNLFIIKNGNYNKVIDLLKII